MFANCQRPSYHKLAPKTTWRATSSKEWVIPGDPLYPTWEPLDQLRGREGWKESEKVRLQQSPEQREEAQSQTLPPLLSPTKMNPPGGLGS